MIVNLFLGLFLAWSWREHNWQRVKLFRGAFSDKTTPKCRLH